MTDNPDLVLPGVRAALFVADLHCEMWYFGTGLFPFELLRPGDLAEVEAIVIAGDLSNDAPRNWDLFLRMIRKQLPDVRILVLPGNHDYYRAFIDREDEMARVAQDGDATMVQKAEVVLGRTRILLCTLWTDYAVLRNPETAKAAAREGMNDFHMIRTGSDPRRHLEPEDTLAIHRDHVAWLEARLAAPFDGETIVVTHHAPVPEALLQPIDSLGPSFGSDLTDMIETHQPFAWFFGHTHRPYQGRIGRTEILNVGLGYPREAPGPQGRVRMLTGLVRFTPEGLPILGTPDGEDTR